MCEHDRGVRILCDGANPDRFRRDLSDELDGSIAALLRHALGELFAVVDRETRIVALDTIGLLRHVLTAHVFRRDLTVDI
jgi:hypothetical protein